MRSLVKKVSLCRFPSSGQGFGNIQLNCTSANGASYISHELKKYLETHEIRHVRTKVYHPMTQGKIERYHRSLKNLILLDNYHAPAELTERIREWVDYYNH